MPRRMLLALLIAGLSPLAPATFPARAAESAAAAAPARHARPMPAATSRNASAAPKAGARSAVHGATVAPGPKTASHPAAPRRLEDVSIEGEIPVPQVLFVTAREQRRMLDFQHRRYLRSSKELGEATPLPRWVAVPQTPPATDPGAHR